MRFQLNFGTSHPLPPFLEGGGKSAPPQAFKEPKKAGSNRVNDFCCGAKADHMSTLLAGKDRKSLQGDLKQFNLLSNHF